MTLRTNIKKLSAVAATALVFTVLADRQVLAAPTTILANITTSSAITVTKVADQTWGTWLLAYVAPNNFTLVMTATTAGVGAIDSSSAVASHAIQLSGGPTPGQVTVGLPTGANGVVVQMSRTVVTDFVDPTISLSTVTYSDATQGANKAFAATPTTVPVTVVTGGTPEPVYFGGTIAVTGTPTDGAHSASYSLSFSY